MKFITVMFTCHKCGIQAGKVPVIAREPEEDITKWMEKVAIAVSKNHSRRSPLCAGKNCDIAVPMPKGDAAIGISAPSVPLDLQPEFMRSKGSC